MPGVLKSRAFFYFTQSSTDFKSSKVQVKHSFKKSEWVIYWSTLIISCFTS